jgi:hypothetical protein
MVKTWRYSSLIEFEQTMLSISEISRIYSLRSLKKHWMCHISYLHNTEIYFFTRFIAISGVFTTKIENHTIFYFSSSSGCWVIIVCRMNYGIILQNNNLEHLQAIIHLKYAYSMFLLITCFIWRNTTVININSIEWCENWLLSAGFLCLCCY